MEAGDVVLRGSMKFTQAHAYAGPCVSCVCRRMKHAGLNKHHAAINGNSTPSLHLSFHYLSINPYLMSLDIKWTTTTITQHHAASRSITQHHAAPRSITQHHAASRSITQHHAASRSTTYKHVTLWIAVLLHITQIICLHVWKLFKIHHIIKADT